MMILEMLRRLHSVQCMSSSELSPEMQSAPTSATKSKSKSKVKSSDSILNEHIVESRRLQDKVETLLSRQDTSHDFQVEIALFFTSMIPHIDEKMLIDYGQHIPNTDTVCASV